MTNIEIIVKDDKNYSQNDSLLWIGRFGGFFIKVWIFSSEKVAIFLARNDCVLR